MNKMKDYANKRSFIDHPTSFQVLMMKNHYAVSDYAVSKSDLVPSLMTVPKNRIWKFIFGVKK